VDVRCDSRFGLSRRRSRVRVPSLPLTELPANLDPVVSPDTICGAHYRRLLPDGIAVDRSCVRNYLQTSHSPVRESRRCSGHQRKTGHADSLSHPRESVSSRRIEEEHGGRAHDGRFGLVARAAGGETLEQGRLSKRTQNRSENGSIWHAEGRGFGSHHPLPNSRDLRGFPMRTSSAATPRWLLLELARCLALEVLHQFRDVAGLLDHLLQRQTPASGERSR
jgi:hypothetical protein